MGGKDATNELDAMRAPFPAHQISKLPKPTKAQTDEVRADYKKGIRCEICGAWHHPKVVHLDYVGHAALTDRLLDVDPYWTWEPLALDENGLPAVDRNGGLWIKLTIHQVTRLGYGSADGKSGGDAVKEIIGDALRNAAMRFGAALDLWHKGDLHVDDDAAPAKDARPSDARITEAQVAELMGYADATGADMKKFCQHYGIASLPFLGADDYADARKKLLSKMPKDVLPDDAIPY